MRWALGLAVIDCGTENDLVLADRQDRIARNCERVLRR
jgi:hypothetical protein